MMAKAKSKPRGKKKPRRRSVSLALDQIVERFESLPDPRDDKNKRHKLVDIVVISVCGVICGCDSFTNIETFGKAKLAFFESFLELPNGIPSHDTFTRVFARLDPEAFQQAFFEWVKELRTVRSWDKRKGKGPVLGCDGKTLRGSHDRAAGLGPLHSVSLWLAEDHLSLGQLAVDKKSNEITAIPKLLEMVDVAGTIVTIDAMGCQKTIVKKIRQRGADYVIMVKGNQQSLLDQVIGFLDSTLANHEACTKRNLYTTHERGHGREEHRTYYQFPLTSELGHLRKDWRDLRTVGVVMSRRIVDGKEQVEQRFYISSLPLNVKEFARAVRGHWGIENSLHWVLDMTFGEDRCRARKGHAALNLGWIRRFTAGLLKKNPSKESTRAKRLRAGWDEDFLLEVLTAQ